MKIRYLKMTIRHLKDIQRLRNCIGNILKKLKNGKCLIFK